MTERGIVVGAWVTVSPEYGALGCGLRFLIEDIKAKQGYPGEWVAQLKDIDNPVCVSFLEHAKIQGQTALDAPWDDDIPF